MSQITAMAYQFDRLIDIPGLSQRLGVPVATIREWVHTRYIPFVKLGRRIYFDTQVINAWIQQKAHPGRLTRKVV